MPIAPREMQPGRSICRICGEVITASERFYRDDPQQGEAWLEINRWVHVECANQEEEDRLRSRKTN